MLSADTPPSDLDSGLEVDEKSENSAVENAALSSELEATKLRMELDSKNFVIKRLESKLQDYERKVTEIREYVKRMEDEIVQIRTRSERDLQKTLDQKTSSFFNSLLPIIDNFERSLPAAQQDSSSLAEGVRLIYKDFMSFLDRENLKRIPTLDQEFNPSYHEAIVNQPVENPDKVGKVVQEFKAGYTYKEAVLRPAQVAVGQAASES